MLFTSCDTSVFTSVALNQKPTRKTKIIDGGWRVWNLETPVLETWLCSTLHGQS